MACHPARPHQESLQVSKTLAILNGVITAIALSDEAVMGLGSYGALVVVADSDTNVVGQRYQALDAPVAASAPRAGPRGPTDPRGHQPDPGTDRRRRGHR